LPLSYFFGDGVISTFWFGIDGERNQGGVIPTDFTPADASSWNLETMSFHLNPFRMDLLRRYVIFLPLSTSLLMSMRKYVLTFFRPLFYGQTVSAGHKTWTLFLLDDPRNSAPLSPAHEWHNLMLPAVPFQWLS